MHAGHAPSRLGEWNHFGVATILVKEVGEQSVHRRPAAAPLVLLPGATRARLVPSDLGSIAPS